MYKIIFLLFISSIGFSQNIQSTDKIDSIEIYYFIPMFCDDCEVEENFEDVYSIYGMYSSSEEINLCKLNHLKKQLENLKEKSKTSSSFYNLKINIFNKDKSEVTIKIDEFNKLYFNKEYIYKLTPEVISLLNELLLNEFEKGNVKCIGVKCSHDMIINSINNFKINLKDSSFQKLNKQGFRGSPLQVVRLRGDVSHWDIYRKSKHKNFIFNRF